MEGLGMITLHGEEIRVGDRVWSIPLGWGEVTELDENNSDYPICVKFEGGSRLFTDDGKLYKKDENPILFWQPIEFEIPKKPKKKEKAWQWICKWGDKYWLTDCYYASEKEVLERNSNSDLIPIEPYWPSEIEREKVE